MTEQAPNASRRVACARCGTTFECGLSGGCWCADEPYRLPLTAAGVSEDCLCPACLRRAAAEFASPSTSAR